MPDRLYGRKRELEQLKGLLTRPALLCIVGAPGIGKSAVARALFRDWSEEEPGAAIFVDAVDATDAAAPVAAALELPADASATAIGNALADRGISLVVLDAAEPLPGTAELLAAAQKLARRARLLAVARERPADSDFTAYRLSPLPVPDSPAAWRESPAVQLFLDRAQRVTEPAALEGHEATVVEIVRATDGHPLGIELAASRLALIGPDELLARMETDTWQSPAESRARFEASWEMLSAAEKSALAQCCVFVGGFDVATSEAVVTLDEGGAVLDVLQTLLDKCLLTPVGMTRRLRVLSVFRQFILERPEVAEDVEAARKRHGEHYLAAVAEGQATQDLWLHERDNVVRAIEDLSAPPGARLRAVATLGIEFGVRMRVRQAAAAIDDASLEAIRAADPALRGRLLSIRGHLRTAFDPDGAESDLRAAIDIARHRGDEDGLCQAMLDLSLAHHIRGDVRASLFVLRSIGKQDDPILTVRRHMYEGRACVQLGRLEDARRALAGQAEAAEAAGSPRLAAITRSLAGWAEAQTDPETAIEAYGKAIVTLGRVRDDVNVALLTGMQGWARLFHGDVDAAEPYFRDALERGRRWGGSPHFESAAGLGFVAARRGACEDALDRLDGAARALADGGLSSTAAHARATCAELAAELGRFDAARRHLGEARELRRGLTSPGTQAAIDLVVARAETALGDAPGTAVADRLGWYTSEGIADVASVARFEMERARELVAEPLRPVPDLLTVGAGGAFFTMDGERIDVDGVTPARILAELAFGRREVPGAVVPLAVLGQAAWPGETLPDKTIANRIRVAVAGLRKSGLAGVLETGKGGYRLSSARPLRIERD